MPSQNRPLWHKDCFELKVTEKQKTIEKSSLPSPICLKAIHKFPFVKVTLSPLSYQEE